MNKPRLLIADDHRIMSAGLEHLVGGLCEVVGIVEDGRTLLESAQRLKPDLILLDISMPSLNGLDAARQIKQLLPDTKLLFVTMHASPSYAAEALSAGGDGYLVKQSAASELLQAVEAVLKDQTYLSPAVRKSGLTAMRKLDQPGLKPSVSDLTPRQREVLQLIAEGKNTKEVAVLLGVSVKTIEFHKARIMAELSVHSTAALIKYAIAERLVTADG